MVETVKINCDDCDKPLAEFEGTIMVYGDITIRCGVCSKK